MEATVQLNVRMSRELRDAGNAALESRGLSPSAFIRAAWGKVSQRGDSLERILEAVYSTEGDVPQLAESESPILAAPELYETFLKDCGLDPARVASSYEERPYKELLEDALTERWRDRGQAYE